MKRVHIFFDDDLGRAWVRAALDGLDVLVRESAVSEASTALVERDVDLAVIDGGRNADAALAAIEQAVLGGIESKALLIVEPEALATLRLPVRVASDFLVRGASSEEFAVRVRNLLWPGEDVVREEIVRIEHLTMNLATYQAHLGSQPIDFTYLEYALFAFLVTHPGRTYSREVLLRRVWGSDYFGGSRTVDVHIRRIRAKIGPELARHLVTVRNVGYLWNA